MKALGGLTLLILIVLSLSSFKALPRDAFLPLSVAQQPLYRPLPYSIPWVYAKWVVDYAEETQVPVSLAARMFSMESTGNPMSADWNPRAVSWAGATGLAQLMPANVDIGTERGRNFTRDYNAGRSIDPYDPETAIRVGLRYLAHLHLQTGSWQLALLSYNGGIGHLLRPAVFGPFWPESIEYANRILATRGEGAN